MRDNCAGCMKALTLADHKARRTFCGPCRTEPCSGDFTREQLTKAFRAVQNPGHWKDEINCFCKKLDRAATEEAIIFFTGSVPTFARVGRTPLLRVKADGYWAAMGA